MRDQNQPLDYYEILGVSHSAPTDEIRRAYRREAMKWHPDRNKDPNAPRMMQLINRAWETLGNSEKRAAYDREYAERIRSRATGPQRGPFEEFSESILPWLLERAIDLYDALGVSINETFEEIDRAYIYRQQTIEDNPNFAGDPAASSFMNLVRIAHTVLSDPEFRAEYDRHYFLMRSRFAEDERARQEAARREFERQERERQREQARREAEARRQREEAERRKRQEEREARERRVREQHEQRERERLRAEREAELYRQREAKAKRREQEQREARERRVREQHERREREKRRERERQKTGHSPSGSTGSGYRPPRGATLDQDGRNYDKPILFILLFAVLAISAALAIINWPDAVSAPEPTATPTPVPVPTPLPRANPTITIDMVRNGQQGQEREVLIQFDNLNPRDYDRYSFIVSVSGAGCVGQGMEELIHLDNVETDHLIMSTNVAAT